MTPVFASLVAQTMPARLDMCVPGSLGWRIAFYGADGSWRPVDTHDGVDNIEAGRALIRASERALVDLARLLESSDA